MLKQPSRSPSPEKRVAMLRTLRTPSAHRKSPVRKGKDATIVRPQAAATAATQAWSARGTFNAADNKSASSTRNYARRGNSSSRHHSYCAAPTQSMENVYLTPSELELSRKSIDMHQCETNAGNTYGNDDTNISLGSRSPCGSFNRESKTASTRKEVMIDNRSSVSNDQNRPVSAPTSSLGVQLANNRSMEDHILRKMCSGPNFTPQAAKLTKQRVSSDTKSGIGNYLHIENSRNTSPIGRWNKMDSIEEPDGDFHDWKARSHELLQNLPPGIDQNAAIQVLNEVILQGDKVRWSDIAGLDCAKSTLKEAVVYPFLRPDLFIGLREPARGLLLFGPPGTGKTMLAKAVATESKSTFFSVSSSTLTSKYHGDSEKLVRALFAVARELAPSVIFVDEIDSLLSARSTTGEHEASRRMKTEFLIQWSAIAKSVTETDVDNDNNGGASAQRVLILAATNLPWAIDAAARRRFARRQYIPLPEAEVRLAHLKMLLSCQKHDIDKLDLKKLSKLTEGYSGSDLTELAKDAAMGPLRSVGDRLLKMEKDDIRSINFTDFEESLKKIKPSVNRESLQQYDIWAKDYGERGG